MAYIDPGTGSLLFSILISMVGTGYYFLRNVKVNAGVLFSGGKRAKDEISNRIPIVIFSDSKRYWNLFEPICDELEKRGQETVYYTSSSDDPALNSHYSHVHCEFIGEGNKAFVKLNYLFYRIKLYQFSVFHMQNVLFVIIQIIDRTSPEGQPPFRRLCEGNRICHLLFLHLS